MTVSHLASQQPATAAQRTELLHRMLLLRHYQQRRTPLNTAGETGNGSSSRPGQEAIAVGVCTALAPSDTVVSTFLWNGLALIGGMSTGNPPPGSTADGIALAIELAELDVLHHRAAVTVCFFDTATTEAPGPNELFDHAVQRQLPILFCYVDNDATSDRTDSTDIRVKRADGMDVEAVAHIALATVGPIRTGSGPGLLDLRTASLNARSACCQEQPAGRAEIVARDGRDPIRQLADRMRTDHQLDDNAFDAIDRDAAAHVDTALASAPAGPRFGSRHSVG